MKLLRRISFMQGVLAASCLLLCGLAPSVAQTLPSRHISTQNGLPHSNVLRLMTDSRGFVWFATEGGAARLCGRYVERFDRWPAIARCPVRAMAVLPHDGVLLATAEAKLYEYQGGRLRSIQPCNSPIPEEIFSMTAGVGGAVWLQHGTHISRLRNDSILRFPLPSLDIDGNEEVPQIRAICQAADTALHLATNHGLWTIANDSLYRRYGHRKARASLYCIDEDAAGNLWLGKEGELIRIDSAGRKSWLKASWMQNNSVQILRADSEGRVLFYGAGMGLGLIEGDSISRLGGRLELNATAINDIVFDDSGGVWLATFGAGVVHIPDLHCARFSVADGLSNNVVRAFAQKKDGRLWIATADGLNLVEEDQVRQIQLVIEAAAQAEPLAGNIAMVVVDSSNVTWTATAERGLLRVPTRDGVASTYTAQSPKPGATMPELMYVDRDGSMLMSCGRGLEQLREGRRHPWDSIPGLDRRRIHALYRQRSGTLWVASDSGAYSLKGGRPAHFGTADGLPADTVHGICEDIFGSVWLATSRGAARRTAQGWRPITKKEGLRANRCTAICADSEGNVWVGTVKGLTCFNSRCIVVYSACRGTLAGEIAALFLDAQGELWIGTLLGASRLRPKELLGTRPVPPPVYITNAVIGNRSVFEPGTLDLTPDDGHVKLFFAALEHSFPEGVTFQYKLDEEDAEWQNTNHWHCEYQLDPGSYDFILRARRANSQWTPQPARLRIEVQAPFWQTWWFRGGVLAVFAALAGAVLQVRRERRRRRAVDQLRLQHKMQQLEIQALNAFVNPHFLFNVLASIQNFYNKGGDVDRANYYFARMGRLVRLILDDAQKSCITLYEELERLRMYLELEAMRLAGVFTWAISIDENIDVEEIGIPVMLLQPFVENAIWHGLGPLAGEGHLAIGIGYSAKGVLCITIRDNGSGYARNGHQRVDRHEGSPSRGISLTEERIRVHEELTGTSIVLQITAASPRDRVRPGTVVTLSFGV